MRSRIASLAVSLLAVLPGMVACQTPAPLRLVPAKADAVLKIDSPRALYDAVYGHPVFKDLLRIDSVAAFYDTTNFRRVLQFIAFFEKELGHERLDLLDRLAGNGIVVAGLFEQKTVLAVVTGKDEEVIKQFVALARKIANQELARLDSKEKVHSRPYRDLETLHLGKDFHVARAGLSLVFSNGEAALKKALDAHLDGSAEGPHPPLAASPGADGKKEGSKPLVEGWLNLEQIRKIQNVKNTLNTLGLDPITMFTIGGIVDIVKRAPFIYVHLTRDGRNADLGVVMGAGREGMAPVAAMFLPEDQRGSLPLLQPPRVLSSTSYFLDISKFWENRHKILTPEQAKGIDKFETQTAKYLKGIGLGTILQQSGKYHRIVTTIPATAPYKIKPSVATASFAVVLDMRDPEFGKSMSKVLRGAALVAGFTYGVRMVEEKHADHTLVTYYFPEKGKLDGDDNNLRFNFSPCFTVVGNQFVISSSLELGKDLIDCLNKEAKDKSSPATQRTHVYGTGIAANLRQSEDLLVSQAILSQALPAASAKKQFEQIVGLVEGLGRIQVESFYLPRTYELRFHWQFDTK